MAIIPPFEGIGHRPRSSQQSSQRDLGKKVDAHLWGLLQKKLYNPEAARNLKKIIINDETDKPEENDHDRYLFISSDPRPREEDCFQADMFSITAADSGDKFLCSDEYTGTVGLGSDLGDDMFSSDQGECDSMFGGV
jgi:hypothetical protein